MNTWIWMQPVAELDKERVPSKRDGEGEYSWKLDTLAMIAKVNDRAEPHDVPRILDWMRTAAVGENCTFDGPFGFRAYIVRGD